MVWDNRITYCLINGMQKHIRKDSHLNMLLFERMISFAGMGLDFDFNGSVLLGSSLFQGLGRRDASEP